MDYTAAVRTIHYASPVVLIGAHEWRVLVISSDDMSSDAPCRVSHSQWRRSGEADWNSYRDWPSYDFNDGVFGGLPRTLSTKLYDRFRRDIDAALLGVAPEPRPQLDLFSAA